MVVAAQQGTRCHFRRQHPIGRYIADFACLEHHLIVEADGSQHGGPFDEERDSYLRSVGSTVVRVWSWDVIRDLDGVLDEIAEALDRLRAASPPRRRPPPRKRPPKGGVIRHTPSTRGELSGKRPPPTLGGVSKRSELVGGD